MTVSDNQVQEIMLDDCWNRIGVHGVGDRSCDKLAHVVHCRHCDNFILAARQLLDRAPLGGYKQEYTKISVDDGVENKLKSVVIFRIGNQWFGLAPKHFHEVIKRHEIHSLPHNRTKKLKGVVAISGELQLCLALEHLLGIEDEEGQVADEKSYERMVVLSRDDERYVFPVNEIRDIHHYSTAELSDPPATVAINSHNAVFGVLNWKERYVSCLDFNLLCGLIDGVFE